MSRRCRRIRAMKILVVSVETESATLNHFEKAKRANSPGVSSLETDDESGTMAPLLPFSHCKPLPAKFRPCPSRPDPDAAQSPCQVRSCLSPGSPSGSLQPEKTRTLPRRPAHFSISTLAARSSTPEISDHLL